MGLLTPSPVCLLPTPDAPLLQPLDRGTFSLGLYLLTHSTPSRHTYYVLGTCRGLAQPGGGRTFHIHGVGHSKSPHQGIRRSQASVVEDSGDLERKSSGTQMVPEGAQRGKMSRSAGGVNTGAIREGLQRCWHPSMLSPFLPSLNGAQTSGSGTNPVEVRGNQSPIWLPWVREQRMQGSIAGPLFGTTPLPSSAL